jgi:hypothetical protein
MSHYAFKCNNCGHLTAAGAAGEMEVPAACWNCGHGVAYDPVTGIKSYAPENWVVLADLAPADLAPILKFHGLDAKDVEKHTPWPSTGEARAPLHLIREGEDSMGAKDKT